MPIVSQQIASCPFALLFVYSFPRPHSLYFCWFHRLYLLREHLIRGFGGISDGKEVKNTKETFLSVGLNSKFCFKIWNGTKEISLDSCRFPQTALSLAFLCLLEFWQITIWFLHLTSSSEFSLAQHFYSHNSTEFPCRMDPWKLKKARPNKSLFFYFLFYLVVYLKNSMSGSPI